jgi:hypothetical protein
MPRTIKLGSYSLTLPDWAPARIAIGISFVCLGFLGFLPILGFWMVPLGVAILSYDIPRVRLFRQKVMAWWRGGQSPPPAA